MNLNEKIDELILCIKRRWELGIDRKIDVNGAKGKVICTSVYGNIEVPPEIVPFIDSFYMQRLRNISQTGFLHYVFPEARHSRFEHSLGVFWVLEQILRNISDKGSDSKLSDSDKTNLRLAALLHDIGHGAFSHVTEIILEWYRRDKKYRNPCLTNSDIKSASYHERRGACIVLGENGPKNSVLKDAIIQISGNESPIKIAKYIQGNTEEWLSPLINGPLDADKFDYFKRDAFFTGTTGGGIEVDYLMRNILISNSKKEIFIPEKSHAVYLQMIYGREFVYGETIYHPVHSCVQSMFMVALNEALMSIKKLGFNVINLIEIFDRMEDRDLWYLLDLLSESRDIEFAIFNNLYGRILRRELYGRLAEYTFYDYTEYLESYGDYLIKKGRAYSKKRAKEYTHDRLKDQFCPLQYLYKEELDKILPSALSNSLNKDDVLILCFQPKISSIEEEKCKVPFEKIRIMHSNSLVKFGSYMKSRIGNHSLLKSLLEIRKVLFKGILLGPKRLRNCPEWLRYLSDEKSHKRLLFHFMKTEKTKWLTQNTQ